MLSNMFRAWSIEKQKWVFFNLNNIPTWVDQAEIDQFIGVWAANSDLYQNDIIKGKTIEGKTYIGRLGFEDGCVVVYTTDYDAPCLYLTIFEYNTINKIGTVLENPEMIEECE